MTFAFHPATLPALPRRMDLGIGIIGCGGIVEYGHMPAYRQAGFNVVGIASRTKANVEARAAKWGIERVFTDWRRLLDLPDVQIVDITYPFDDERLEIVREAAARGKHILMQKPFAHSMAAANEMIRLAEQAGVLLAVNQNARWCPQYRAARIAIEQGLLGDIYFAIHEMQNNQDSQPYWQERWYAQVDRFQIMEYSVHHLDLLRHWWGGEPTSVKATIARRPSQSARGEMIATVQMAMPDAGLAVMVDDNASHPKAPAVSRFRIEGTAGMITGEVSANSSFTIHSDLLGNEPQSPALQGTWFPGSFIGTMGELMRAIEENRQPTISARDNIKTLEIIFKAYENAGKP